MKNTLRVMSICANKFAQTLNQKEKLSKASFFILLMLMTVNLSFAADVTISDIDDLSDAISSASPGDIITVSDGSYDGNSISATSIAGTSDNLITVKAETIGGVTLEGDCMFSLTKCSYIVIQGFVFETSSGSAIKLSGCNNIRVTRNVFDLAEEEATKWVYIGGVWDEETSSYSHDNRVDHNTFQNKTQTGHYLTIDGSGSVTQSQNDIIDHNYFKNNTPRATNEKESIRVGWSEMSESSGYTTVEFNLFEECNGDPEIISIKSCDNIVRHNTIRESEGTISLRHGSRNRVEGNYIFGGDAECSTDDDGTYCTGGIRIYGEDHVIVNNYIEGIKGTKWDAPITLTWGDAESGESSLSDHFRIERAIIAYNTLVDNDYGIEIGYTNSDKYTKAARDVVFAYNLVQQSTNDLVNFISEPDNMTWVDNVMYATGTASLTNDDRTFESSEVSEENPYLTYDATIGAYKSTSNTPTYTENTTYTGGDIDEDIHGDTRGSSSTVGADDYSTESVRYAPLTSTDVGPDSYHADYEAGLGNTTEEVDVTGVSVSPTSTSLSVDGTQQLSTTVSPSSATDQGVSYSSNSTSVATVSSSGLITAVAEGSATITVTTDDGSYTATCSVTVTEETSTAFVPDPDKTYYIDCPELDFRLAATGESEDAYTTTTSTTGEDVEWKFTDKGNGYWHLDRAAGGTSPRLRTDNTANADMQTTTYSGTYTYYDFATGASSSTYFLTLPDGPTSYCRLQIDNTGAVNMVSTANAGTSESFSITEVSDEEVELTNLALEQSVTASDYEQTATPPSNAVDGDSDSRWAASGYSQWVQVDLGATYSISNTELVCYNDRAYQYITEVSTDGSSYTQIVDRSSNSTGGSNDAPITDEFTEVDARYVRITVSGADSYTGTWVSLEEFRVYGDASSAKSAEGASSISEYSSKNNISAYPNPASDVLNIKLENNSETTKVGVYSSTGQLVKTQTIEDGSGTVDISTLFNGLYFLKTNSSNPKVTTFIKE